ncbi:hypothetical protein FB451DRAFT_1269904 [Mycena latifolia]|nr:hypothetical protein FB451DRAFT_1269904 [Mycena latifolia]
MIPRRASVDGDDLSSLWRKCQCSRFLLTFICPVQNAGHFRLPRSLGPFFRFSNGRLDHPDPDFFEAWSSQTQLHKGSQRPDWCFLQHRGPGQCIEARRQCGSQRWLCRHKHRSATGVRRSIWATFACSLIYCQRTYEIFAIGNDTDGGRFLGNTDDFPVIDLPSTPYVHLRHEFATRPFSSISAPPLLALVPARLLVRLLAQLPARLPPRLLARLLPRLLA